MDAKSNVKPAKKTLPQNSPKPWKSRPADEGDRDILSRALADISQESLVQGLIYSEIFGLPKCKRRGR